jgi:hypothetical protein
MFILDKPYVSDFLANSVGAHAIPVLRTEFAEKAVNGRAIAFEDEGSFIAKFRNGDMPLLYTNSENAIGWVSRNLHFTDLPDKIDLFKDKVRFRQLLQPLNKDFYFKEVSLEGLDRIDPSELNYPFILKPAVGFFSHGVHKVECAEDWPGIVDNIKKEVAVIREVYPAEVLDTTRFIIEGYIEGREFAFDAYFNDRGQPVILGLLEHLFSSSSDVSDRVYISSAPLYNQFLDLFTGFLSDLGQLAGLRNFPLHVEVRLDEKGNLRPIEINPLRFGGWCTTADMTWYAYGFNSYKAVARNEAPDWRKLLAGKENKIYSNIVLTNSTGYDVSSIKAFDYESLKAKFENPLEMRRADYREFLIFGFLFAETSIGNYREIDWILNDDLREFITLF